MKRRTALALFTGAAIAAIGTRPGAQPQRAPQSFGICLRFSARTAAAPTWLRNARA
jgi:hypothetical protein